MLADLGYVVGPPVLGRRHDVSGADAALGGTARCSWCVALLVRPLRAGTYRARL